MIRIIFIILFFIASSAFGANYAVSPSGSGNGSGSDWSNTINWGTISFSRGTGNTYYLMDGTYAGKSISTPVSGSYVITIKKATDADYGGLANWSSANGNGQATFSGGINLYTDYITIDGATRNESNWADPVYGIKIPSFYTNSSTYVASHITLKYLDIGADYGQTYSASYGDGIYIGGFSGYGTYWLVQRCYIHNVLVAVQNAGVEHVTYEYNYIGPTFSKTAIRHQIRGTYGIYRYNIFKNACQGKPDDPTATGCTAIITYFGNGDGVEYFDNSEVYGNVFWDKGDVSFNDGGILMGGYHGTVPYSYDSCVGCVAYNNTFIGMGKNYVPGDFGQAGVSFTGSKTGTIARNNIWYDNSPYITIACSAGTCSNNIFSGLTSGVFVNAVGGNFHLTSDGAAGTGYSLSSPHNTDMDGVTRGQGTYFDVGAYEYISGAGGDYIAPTVDITTIDGSSNTSATYATSSNTINISGTATDAVGVTSVTWACPTCTPTSDTATCTGCTGLSVTWEETNIVLSSGENVITVSATDGTNTGVDVLTVTYTPISDLTPPTVLSVSVNGATATITFDETVVTTGYDTGDFNLDCTSPTLTDVALSSPSGSGASRTFIIATPIVYGQVCNLDYVGSTNDIEDTAGNDMVAFSNMAVTNNTPAVVVDPPSSVRGVTLRGIIRR